MQRDASCPNKLQCRFKNMVPLFEEIAQDEDRPSHNTQSHSRCRLFSSPLHYCACHQRLPRVYFFDLTRVTCEAVRLKVAVEMSLHLAVNTPSTKSRRKQVAVIICENVAIMLMYASCCAPEGRCFRVVRIDADPPREIWYWLSNTSDSGCHAWFWIGSTTTMVVS
jgi:hypothetical protein